VKEGLLIVYDYNTGSQSNVWDELADNYEASRQNDSVYMSCTRQVNNKVPNGITLFLDAGCGTGIPTIGFANRAKAVVAIDYSFKSLKILKQKGSPNTYPVQADITALPFMDAVFNYSACINTLNHFCPGSTQEKAISELRRVTKNKSSIMLSVHHYSKDKKRAGWIKEGKPGQPGVDYIFRFERGDLLKIMPKSTIVAVGYLGLCKIPFIGRRVQNLAARMFGRIAAILGYGHMLIGVEQNDKDDRVNVKRTPNDGAEAKISPNPWE
jgi:ubiquinone/menaquinone biosynthesis C-methylase UbiE